MTLSLILGNEILKKCFISVTFLSDEVKKMQRIFATCDQEGASYL